ncbi:MAG: gliding motility-associated C-terminal domain-containing protein [Tannerellaceae bacterium]|nr:gliding motility-associated C-terminal domain-containing protein [Tannerellaceae bacterium]MCD8263098.1 gliding motility-associated C-terminal domain-containing protein [Tannerellaceae bacterium]
MLRNFYRRWVGLLGLLLFTFTLHAQYSVSGGSGQPLLAVDDTPNKLQVYLVYGSNNVEIAYTSSSSTTHTWYRYKNRALDPEPVVAEQQGTRSVVRNPEEGYGYFVAETNVLSSYVWLIDYSKYAFDISSLSVLPDCEYIQLTGDMSIPAITYYTPSGASQTLERSFEIAYQTAEWRGEDKQFVMKSVSEIREGSPLKWVLEPPLTDTEIILSGDMFARHFGVEKGMATELYQTTAIQVYCDTLLVDMDAPNRLPDGDLLSAPVEVLFTAYGSPAVSRYQWTIYDAADENQRPLISFNGEEVEYTFRQAGTFVAQLEVSDRMNECTQTCEEYKINIAESWLTVPNAFSPGTSPGYNDEFRVTYRSIVSFKGWIFNRWGNQLFHWTDPAQGWDGKKGGNYVPPGVYFYVIEAKGSDGVSHNRRGSINILRPKTIQDEIY